MKKLLLMKTVLLLFALVVGSNAWALNVNVLSEDFSSNNTIVKLETAGWTFSGKTSMQSGWLQVASGKGDGTAKTPAFASLVGNSATLTFKLISASGTARTLTITGTNCKVDGNASTTKTAPANSGSESSITISITNASTASTITFSAAKNAGCKIDEVVVYYESSTPSHSLTYSATNGSISGVDAGSNAVASGASVAEGATVTLTATPSTGYKFTSWNVSGTGSSLTSETTNPTTFTMGTANATVTANFEVDNTVATPTFDPDGSDTYTQAQNITISCATGGATIHYTTNGDDPTESDATYSSAISIKTSGTVLKAKAFKDGMTASAVASATYTIKPNKPTVTAAGATVTITGDDGLEFYYTTDGTTTPTKSSTKYTGPFNPGADCTIKARAYDANDNASTVTSFTYKYFPLLPKDINSGYYVKVTDVNDLENGDAILIVNESADKALGPQDGNNCPSKDVTITNNVISDKEDAQKLVLVKKTEEVNDADTDVFYFYTGSAYLYAASSGSNHLKTEATPDANARATISISAGNAAIQFTGSNTRNQLKYNSTSDLFSCYSSGQNAVQIYKEVAHSESLTPAKTYTTLTSAYALDFTSVSSDIKAYIATEVSGSAVQMIQVNKVPANTGLVLKATTPKTTVNVPVFDGTGADNVTANKMAGSATETTAIAANAGYILSEGAFHPATAGTLAAGKAYLAIAVSSARTLEMTFDDDVTAIEAVKAQNVENGQFFNLAGQRVAQPTKGLYIVNGKKVIIK